MSLMSAITSNLPSNPLSGADERMGQMAQMISLTNPTEGASRVFADENLMRTSVFACLRCKSTALCKAWIENADGEAEPPEFCPNAGRLRPLLPDN